MYGRVSATRLYAGGYSLPQSNCYLHHHCVVKPDSTAIKFRVVFNASAKSTSSAALSDILLADPTIQVKLYAMMQTAGT